MAKTIRLPRITRELVQCQMCGYCIDVCEAHRMTPWESVTPRGKIYYLNQLDRRGIGLIDKVIGRKATISPEFVDAMYKCTGCGNCEEVCHAKIELVKLWEIVRAWLVQEGVAPLPVHKGIARKIATTGNSFGEPASKRDAWWPADVERAKVPEAILYAGCTGSYRMQHIPAAGAQILARAGVKINCMGADEVCCSSPLLRVGIKDQTMDLAIKTVTKADGVGAHDMIMTCSGCFKTISSNIGDYYSKTGQNVYHFTQYVDKLIKEKKLPMNNEFNARVTYHDPCHLGRHSKVYEEPRNVLKKIKGIDFVEMEKNRDHSRCCGAGGGYKSAFNDFAVSIAAERIKDAEEVGAEVIATACPFCVLNLKAGAKKAGSKIKVMDISEILLHVTAPKIDVPKEEPKVEAAPAIDPKELEEAKAAAEAAKAAAEAAKKELAEAKAAAEAAAEAAKKELAEARAAAEAAKKNAEATEKQLDEAKITAETAKKNAEIASKELSEAKAAAEAAKKNAEATKKELADAKSSAESAKKNAEATKKELADTKAAAEIAEAKAAEAEAAKAEVAELNAKLAEAETALAVAKAAAETAEAKAAEAEAAKAEVAELNAKFEQAEAILAEADAAIEQAEKDIETTKAEVAGLNAKLAQAEAALVQAKAAAETAEARAAGADAAKAEVAELNSKFKQAEAILAEADAAIEQAEKDIEAAKADAEAQKLKAEKFYAEAEAILAEADATIAKEKTKFEKLYAGALAICEEADIALMQAEKNVDELYNDEEDLEVEMDEEDFNWDVSPEGILRRAAWNKKLRCRRNYGDFKIPVAFVKGKVAVYVDIDASAVKSELEDDGWVILSYNGHDITDGEKQAIEIRDEIKSQLRKMKKGKKKKK